MQEKLNIAVFVDYDNIEIGLKTTLHREFDVSLPIESLKERGDIVAKFAYANWGRQEGATRQMAENAVQMVQRIPSPRGDKNGADINLALDALEMAFTHSHVNAFAIVSGDSDFIPLVNKLKEYGKTVFVVGGKAFTSTILQQNCHEFISYESLLMDVGDRGGESRRDRGKDREREREPRQALPPIQGPQNQPPPQQPPQQQPQQGRQEHRQRPAPLELTQAMPLVERALQVLERRGVQPQLGLLKSTMLQLDPAFSEKAYGCGSFSEFVDKLKRADYVNVTGSGGRTLIERKPSAQPEHPARKPEDALPTLRDVLETHRLEIEVQNGVVADDLASWFTQEQQDFDWKQYGFQEFGEFLNYAQDKLLVRVEPDEERGLIVFLGAEFYPPAQPVKAKEEEEVHPYDEAQPFVAGQPTIFEPNPPPAPEPPQQKRPRVKRVTKKASGGGGGDRKPRRPAPRKKKTE
jgi:uncharacterized protein (TIGR00288 family)